MHISCPKLFVPSIQVNRKIKRVLVCYFSGLVLHPGKKNCSAIARVPNESLVDVYSFLEFNVEEKDILKAFLNRSISTLPMHKRIWYISIDETMIDKMFSAKI